MDKNTVLVDRAVLARYIGRVQGTADAIRTLLHRYPDHENLAMALEWAAARLLEDSQKVLDMYPDVETV